MTNKIIIFAFIISTNTLFSAEAETTAETPYIITADSIMNHILVLAHDSLEGRKVGEIGEQKAADYISGLFEQLSLKPISDNNNQKYLIPFDFTKSIDIGERTSLLINNIKLELGTDFYPLKNSASKSFGYDQIINVGYGIKTDTGLGAYNDYEGLDVEGKAVVIMRFFPDPDSNPHVDFEKYAPLSIKIRTALDHKAGAIFFITPEDKDDTLISMGSSHITPKDIPIVMLRHAGLKKAGLDMVMPTIETIAGECELIKIRDTGYNVVGLLLSDNDTMIIIGAHYDHLGYGGSGSRYMGKDKQIHNGADDNGSGTAGLLELARYFSSRKDELKYSILFMAFSGEESGLLGSGNFVKGPLFNKSKTRMMLNMDMIGRLKAQENGLAIFGTGTCLEFKDFFDKYENESIKLTLKESGTGPSDHTAFYNREIPVLHFFTGAHNDYHKPSDDVELIDAPGIVSVIELLSEIVNYFDQYASDLTFQKTKDPNAGKRASSFSVTLGIMPDYIAEVVGLKVDGVSPERPGEKAGLLPGDIILRIGTIDIGDIYDYMGALGNFRKGDSTFLLIARGADTLNLPVVF